jgi:hypothetical protein
MYCPMCFNDTLKIASSGVVKLTFNGKSKSTSQFFYNLNQDSSKEIIEKLDFIIKDYFVYYSNFQNKDPIESVEAVSIDFICRNGCILNVSHKVNVIGLIFDKKDLIESLEKMGKKYSLDIKLKL